jgi:hypothetical protein
MQKTLKTKAVVCFLIITIALIIIEVGSFSFFYIKYGKSIPKEEIHKTLLPSNETIQTAEVEDPPPTLMKDHVLHPYLGYVRNHKKSQHIFDEKVVKIPVNTHGFFGISPLEKKKKDEIHIALMGGSVATQLFLYSKDQLIKKLQKNPFFKNKKLKVISIALGGMKQPQQSLALNLFLVLGGKFDIVINLDGFNEIALPYLENIPVNVYPFYPRFWHFYAAKAIDTDVAALIGKGALIKEEREYWRKFFSWGSLKHSSFFLTVWYALNKQKQNEFTKIHNQIRESLKLRLKSPQQTGPEYTFDSPDSLFKDSADVWKNSSLQMAKISKSNNIKYFHFLQPNQYLKDSKVFTEEEKKTALAGESQPFAKAVRRGYPFLMEAGQSLKNSGIQFEDLTALFKKETQTIYKDFCCHYNQYGNDLLATEIANIISKHSFNEN